jgi:hypothetical protein
LLKNNLGTKKDQKVEMEMTSPEILESGGEEIDLKQHLPSSFATVTTAGRTKEDAKEVADGGSEILSTNDARKNPSQAGMRQGGVKSSALQLPKNDANSPSASKQSEQDGTKKLTTATPPVKSTVHTTTVTADDLEEMKRERSEAKALKRMEEQEKEEMEQITFGFRKLNIKKVRT